MSARHHRRPAETLVDDVGLRGCGITGLDRIGQYVIDEVYQETAGLFFEDHMGRVGEDDEPLRWGMQRSLEPQYIEASTDALDPVGSSHLRSVLT